VPPVSVEGHSGKDSVEGGVRPIEGQPSPLSHDEYQDDDERARLAQVRAAHPHLSIPALRLVAAAATERVVTQLALSNTS
jgi:protocatechuate 3,4-dioxygenase beta subunit